jgi:type VI secretion system secreted protein VgrG
MSTPADPRGISITTPLGPDVVFLTGFRGREALSQLFHFQLDIMAESRQSIAFDKLIGQKITFSVLLPDGKTKRFWNGICSSLAQAGRDSTFTTYRMEVVPQLWLLTRRKQSRIFQYLSVPDILKKVFTGLDVKLELQGTFEPRDYCVQYRESDFAFASRLMEEEGIYYFFKHTDGGHQLVLGNSPQTHPAVAFSEKALYEELEGGNRPDMRVKSWEKTQELRSGKVTLWDHHFELPHQHLDAERPTQESVSIGKVTHKLKLAANDPLEVYDYPGAYAQRFDGVDAGGGDSSGSLAKIFQDNKRTAAIRMEQEAVQAITIRGSSNCRQFMAGHKFTLERHFDADGAYVLTSVDHSASASAGGRSGADGTVNYQNHFTCIPLALPFRPPQTTEKPIIPGPQTAVVVGPKGETIFCDKYGRVKVQFHWDRQGKMNADSSCWIRVSNNWGGANWGGIFIPHVKQEVIVEFEEGDPDRPLITGRVYNAECMPPRTLPDNKTQSNLSDHGGNYLLMEGISGKQQIDLYSPKCDTQLSLGQALSAKGTHHYPDKLPIDAPKKRKVGPLDGVTQMTNCYWVVYVGANANFSIKGNCEWVVGGHWDQEITGWFESKIDDFFYETVENNYTVKVTAGNYQLDVDTGTFKETIKGNYTTIVKGALLKIDCLDGDIDIHCGGHYVRKGDKDDTETINGHVRKTIHGSSTESIDYEKYSTVLGLTHTLIKGLKTEFILGGEVKKLGPYKSETVLGFRKSFVKGKEILKAAAKEEKAAKFTWKGFAKAAFGTVVRITS